MIFYRYEDNQDSVGIKIDLIKFIKLRETPCGHWIVRDYYERYPDHTKEKAKKWISKTSAKRYAYPTKLEAVNNLIMRKRRQMEHCRYFLDRAEKAKGSAKTLRTQLEQEVKS